VKKSEKMTSISLKSALNPPIQVKVPYMSSRTADFIEYEL